MPNVSQSPPGGYAGRDERQCKQPETVVENTGIPAMTGTDTGLSVGEYQYRGFSRYGANADRGSKGVLGNVACRRVHAMTKFTIDNAE